MNATRISPRSMIVNFKGVVRVLKTGVAVSRGFRQGLETPPEHVKFLGLWDTGATGTAISKEVITRLNLKPVGKAPVCNAHGEVKLCDTFFINLVLPCEVGLNGIIATEGSFGPGVGVLIGMDVISQGDFSISNFDGKTTFSFRIPSEEHIELRPRIVPSISVSNIGSEKFPGASRNRACPCGSGKKYKHCCAKAAPVAS